MINWPYPFDFESLRPCTEYNFPERQRIRTREHNYDLEKKRARHSIDHFMDEILQPIVVQRDDPELAEIDPNLSKLSPKGQGDQVTVTDDKFIITCPIPVGFLDEELTVKTHDDFITLEGRHEEKSGNSQFSRTFSHKWSIPEGVQVDQMKCHVNPSTKKLLFEAPRLKEDFQMAKSELPIEFQKKNEKPFESEMEKMLDFA